MNKIEELLSSGVCQKEVSKLTGYTKSTVNYYAKKLGLTRSIKRHNWVEIKEYQNKGYSTKDCCQKFNISMSAWSEACNKNLVQGVMKERKSTLLTKGSHVKNSSSLKKALLSLGSLEVCEICGQKPLWKDKFLVLQVHHLDGDNKNNTIENLQILCPNCHSQTDNYAGKSSRGCSSTD